MSEERTCKNCGYFYRYYIRSARGRYSPLLYGHCIKPRLKKRFISDKACLYWEEKTK